MRLQKTYWIICLCLLASFCHAQNIAGSFVHGGITRSYTVHIPTNYTAAMPCPLVLNLHGFTSNGTAQALLTRMNAIADTAGFIVVYPEGTLNSSQQQFWNAGYGAAVDDVGFLSALIDTISNNYAVNTARVYSTGLSNGAIMSNTLACELDDKIAAIAGVAGTMSIGQYNNCSPTNPMPVLHIHGTTDAIVPYAGTTGLIGVQTLVDHWRMHNNLSTNYTTISIPNSNLLDGSTVELRQYETGSNAPVHLYRITNGGHSWPGSGVTISGNTNMDFNASSTIWAFFNQYSLTTSINTVTKPTIDVHLLTQPVVQTLEWQISTNQDYTVSVYNSLGVEVITTQQYNDSMNQLNVKNLEQGVYFAVFSINKTLKTIKFIKV